MERGRERQAQNGGGGLDSKNNRNKVKDEEMSAQDVKGFSGRRGETWENGGGLKSSRDAQREETLKMTQFITITATKEREGEK